MGALARPLGVNALSLPSLRIRPCSWSDPSAPHLLLEKFRLNLDYTMHIFRLNQLVAEIESRCDIPGPLATRAASAIPEVDKLLEKASQGPGKKSRKNRRRWRGNGLPCTRGGAAHYGDTIYIDGAIT